MQSYWIHRISHKSEVSYPLLEKGYLSIGFADFANEEFLNKLRNKNKDESWECFENKNNEIWKELRRTRHNLWRFLYEFKVGDVVLVPMYKSFSLYKITSDPIISGLLEKEIITSENKTNQCKYYRFEK